jgi:predicted RNA binding protein YcfA (HicA-like mRNA interferase family)
MKFGELVRLLEDEGFASYKEKGSSRYYAKSGWTRLIRVDYHGEKGADWNLPSYVKSRWN